MSSMIGISARPFSVSVYSTRGGTAGKVWRSTMPSSSRARRGSDGERGRPARLDVGQVVHRRAALAVGGDEELEVVRARGRLERLLHAHAAGLQVLEQVLVERLHAVERALGDDLGQAARLLRIHDEV